MLKPFPGSPVCLIVLKDFIEKMIPTIAVINPTKGIISDTIPRISAITESLFVFCSVAFSGISVLCYVLFSICLTLSVICKVNIAKVVCNPPLRLFYMRRTII